MFWTLLFLVAVPALADVELEAISRSNEGETERIWTDAGGLSNDDFICWGPISPGQTYRALGYRGQRNHDPIQYPIYAFKELANASAALVDAVSFEFIWDDRRSIMWNDGSLWRANCPNGYVAVGDFFYPQNRIAAPGQDLKVETKCVRADLTGVCDDMTVIWQDKGSLASMDVSTWEPVVDHTMLGGFLFGNNQHDVPPANEHRCLLHSSYVLLS